MKLGIVSDTHGDVEVWQQLYHKYLADATYILHCGDVLYHGPRNPVKPGYNPAQLAEVLNHCPTPMYFVQGNCDAEVDQMVLNRPILNPFVVLSLDGKTLVANHGHKLDQANLSAEARKLGADILVYGHTHIPILEKQADVLLVNPGSCSLPKGDGTPTFVLWESGTFQLINIATDEVIKQITLD